MTKAKRPYKRFSQDFSGESKTDTSFGPACDVNTIVKHYADTGIDPFIHRKSQERFEAATTLSYDEAMRQKAEADSYVANLTPSERAQHIKSFEEWGSPPEEIVPSEASEDPPEGSTESKSEEKEE